MSSSKSSSSSSSSSTPGVCVPPTSGTDGFATRFWDCCKPTCAWPGKGGSSPVASCSTGDTHTDPNTQSACAGGSSHACYNFAPWAKDANTAYGYAAFNGAACGDCYELTFTGQSNSRSNDPGSNAICGKKLIVQVVNTGGIAGNQFDIMVPGGGVGDFNACSQQWGTTNLGQTYGGFLLACEGKSTDYATYKACAKTWCSTVFTGSDKAELLAGCNWLEDWLQAADNPKVKYTKVACPADLTSKSKP